MKANILFRIVTIKGATDDIVEANFDEGVFKSESFTYTYDNINTFYFSVDYVKKNLMTKTTAVETVNTN